jgi:enoyl-CoA hydratase/carnithine racemase
VLRSLFENLARAHRDPTAKAIVVIGSNNNFSPGFDIMQFKQQSGGGGIDDKVRAVSWDAKLGLDGPCALWAVTVHGIVQGALCPMQPD